MKRFMVLALTQLNKNFPILYSDDELVLSLAVADMI